MASTITLANTIAWALPFIQYQPVTIGTANEPAITSANIIKQTVLGPPFVWRWNRNIATTMTLVPTAGVGTQDYSIPIADFGFFEKATITDPSTGAVKELEWKSVLSSETLTNTAPPTFISTQMDDNAGNITFRLMPVPDAAYTLTIVYQKAPTLFAGTADKWSPIPDYMAYIFNRGFLAFAYEKAGDAKFSIEHTRWLASLLSASEGLSEMEKNIFLGNALSTTAQAQAAGLRTQQGAQGRGT